MRAASVHDSEKARSLPHVCVCVCTYRRPELLRRLLTEVDQQATGDLCTFSVVIADNDSGRSAESLVASFAQQSRHRIVYCCEPTQNIALVRNRAIANAQGDYIAFLDDDEFPAPKWLVELLATLDRHSVAGVLGPVRPYFDTPPPAWLVKGRFCERPEHPTGMVMEGGRCRTGNVLFRRSIVEGVEGPFSPVFGTGGEDVDFFRRMEEAGHKFVWCNEGIAYELVPPSRCTRSYMLKRALLRGRSNLRLKQGRIKSVLTSLFAVPVYLMVLPFSFILGHHVFMQYMIRFCDHFGRLLALLGINPVTSRPGM
jgi:succinoglycan biosynthesis protein ExoM